MSTTRHYNAQLLDNAIARLHTIDAVDSALARADEAEYVANLLLAFAIGVRAGIRAVETPDYDDEPTGVA